MPETGSQRWPFPDPKDAQVITVLSIIERAEPVRYVCRVEGKHSWQFLDGGPVDPEEARAVTLGEMVEFDESLRDLADLPVGWYAWRDEAGEPWSRAPSDDEDE